MYLPFLLLLAATSAFSFTKNSIKARERARIYDSSTSQTSGVSFKQKMFDLLVEAPQNAPSPSSLTYKILQCVKELEMDCPTPDEQVVPSLAGTWELWWTTQDSESPESRTIFSWINPLENQSYSNNPIGRANPVLPVAVQNQLEQAGFLSSATPVRKSTQSIDIKKGQVRNVVSLGRRASLTVSIRCWPDQKDLRRINVKFDACRVNLRSFLDVEIPLGVTGPTGWLRTSYIDDDMRITRGHKGSVFILVRPGILKEDKP